MNMYQFSDKVREETERSRKSLYINLAILIVVVIAYTIWQNRGTDSMKMQWSESALMITDPKGDVHSFALDQLQKISLHENWDFGTQVEGGSDRFYRYGIWENDSIGKYEVYTSQQCTDVILLEFPSQTVAISYESNKITADLYESVISMIEGFGYHPETDPTPSQG